MKATVGIAVCALMLAVTSCKIEKLDNGPLVSKSVEVTDFDEVEINGAFDVTYTVGEPSVTIKAGRNLHDIIEVRQENSKIIVTDNDDRVLRSIKDSDLQVICSSPNLKAMKLNGSGEIEFDNVTLSTLRLTVNGSGDIEWKGGSVENLNVAVFGSGDMSFDKTSFGKCRLTLSGSGDIEGTNTNIGDLSTVVEGSGNIMLKGIKINNLNAELYGSGDIFMQGDVQGGTVNIGGSGDVHLDVPDKSKIRIIK